MGAIAVEGLTKAYGPRLALDRVDLDVSPGAVHGLVGPNGAGKSTLLRILLRLVRPDSGRATVLGRTDGLEGIAGFVEAPRFPPELTAAKVLGLLASYDHGPAPAVDDVLDRVGLGGRGHDRVGGFSVGMRQRLGLASCLLRSPRVLLLDEPTSGLDPTGARETQAIIARLAAGGTTVLLSSHDLTEVSDLCSAVTVLREGRVAFDGSLAQARAQAPAAEHRLRTSDDHAAARTGRTLRVEVTETREGLLVSGRTEALDAFVLELASEGIAVRALEQVSSPLAALYDGLVG